MENIADENNTFIQFNNKINIKISMRIFDEWKYFMRLMSNYMISDNIFCNYVLCNCIIALMNKNIIL